MLIGVAIGVCVALAALLGLFLYFRQKLIFRGAKDVASVVQRLCDFGQNEDVIVLATADDRFVQFRKYAYDVDQWGVDFVFPLVQENASKRTALEALSRRQDVELVVRETPFGWPFLFLEVTREGAVQPHIIKECLSVAGVADARLGFDEGTTLDITTTRKVGGATKASGDWSSRYNVDHPDQT